jgi:photosystem II stability/assembly factor-like uncharacterized protein
VTGEKVAWATGTQGTVLRTSDGGASWHVCVVPGGESLDFRDVHAFDERAACILAVGPGASSRIYRTADAGATWSLAYRDDDPKTFLDAIAFWLVLDSNPSEFDVSPFAMDRHSPQT